MKKFIAICFVLMSCFCLGANSFASPIVLQKIDKDTALVTYPAHKEYGYPKYEKVYYVKDNILRNYADDDEIKGYRIEKIDNITYSYTTVEGHSRTVSCGWLIKKDKKLY